MISGRWLYVVGICERFFFFVDFFSPNLYCFFPRSLFCCCALVLAVSAAYHFSYGVTLYGKWQMNANNMIIELIIQHDSQIEFPFRGLTNIEFSLLRWFRSFFLLIRSNG